MKSRKVLLILLASSAVAAASAQAEELKQVIQPNSEFGYSAATVVPANARTIYIAGQTGVDAAGPNDFQSQVDRSFQKLLAVLKAAGGRVEDVVKITIFVKNHDQQKMAYIKQKRRQVFGDSPPASTMIPVPSWPSETLEFEIDAIAVAR